MSFFFQAEDGIRDKLVTGVQTCALPISLIAQDFRNVFDRGVDLLFTPTTPTPAFKAGEKLNDPVAMYLSDIFTVTANLAGLPAISVPIGRIKGLPIGGQLIGQAFLEDEKLEAAYALERAVPAGEDA